MRRLLLTLVVAALPSAALAQFDPPDITKPEDATLKAIAERTDTLAKALADLRRQGVGQPALADVEVYHKAAVWIARHNEWFQKDAGARTLAVLDRGLLRASQLGRGETPWLHQPGFSTGRGYRSSVDGSVQPYAVTYPADFGKDPRKKWRVDVVLHGRTASLTEVSFLHGHLGGRPAPADQPGVVIDIYGRGNNAYRWAGETDVYEVLDNFLAVEARLGRGLMIDTDRFVLRGFSMGGAGTWHLGLHRPDRWCVLGPGAGFTTTKDYVGDRLPKLSAAEEKMLHLYDAVDYAENARMVPVVAYSGALDKQMQAAVNVEEKLKPLGIPMTHLVAPELEHKFPPEWQKKAEAEYAKHAAKGRPEYPKKVAFVTYTLKYPGCYWVEILGLDRHYERTSVEAERTAKGFAVKTANVRALDLALEPSATREALTVAIDGQTLDVTPWPLGNSLRVVLEKHDGKWEATVTERVLTDRLRRPQKVAGQQGPIDDAFTSSFLCVRGTGTPWHDATGKYAAANLERFRAEWSKFMRADLPVKDDADVTPRDIAAHHLVVFGDPASNSVLRRMMPGLPFKWTKDAVSWDGKDYAAADHVPVLIYPSPLTTERYVVLNSGHTFHAPEFQGTNALLFPRLGDYALLKLDAAKGPLGAAVEKAGLFNEFWRTGEGR